MADNLQTGRLLGRSACSHLAVASPHHLCCVQANALSHLPAAHLAVWVHKQRRSPTGGCLLSKAGVSSKDGPRLQSWHPRPYGSMSAGGEEHMDAQKQQGE